MFDNIHKVILYSDIIPYVCGLTNNVPMGWGIFSVLTIVNDNSPIFSGGGGGE